MTLRRALSVRQPWADCITDHGKRYENRSWCLPKKRIGQRIWLHAGLQEDISAPLWVPGGPGDKYHEIGGNRYGALLAVIVFDRCDHDSADPWWFGPHGWHIAEMTPLERPIPYKGAQSFFGVAVPDMDQVCPSR